AGEDLAELDNDPRLHDEPPDQDVQEPVCRNRDTEGRTVEDHHPPPRRTSARSFDGCPRRKKPSRAIRRPPSSMPICIRGGAFDKSSTRLPFQTRRTRAPSISWTSGMDVRLPDQDELGRQAGPPRARDED